MLMGNRLRSYWPLLAFAVVWALSSQPNVNAQTSPGGTPVVGSAKYRGTINSSVVIATGNTFQQVLASIIGATGQTGVANVRQSLTIENNNASDSCWVFIGPTASAAKGTSILLLAGGSYTRYWPYVPPDNIAATCASNSDTLYVDSQ